MRQVLPLFFLFTVSLFISCKSSKVLVEYAPFEKEVLDTLYVYAPKVDSSYTDTDVSVYRASATRVVDLIHTKVDVRFDWSKQQVLGKAELLLKPLFYEIDEFALDAKTFDIHSVKLGGKEIQYEYDSEKLICKLDRTYTRQEQFVLNIDYTAKPNEGPRGGSKAISSDKGLFFINPESKNKFKPQQIWTQGETENNSKWFPTIDKPNERCTQEVIITVDDKFKTLSNGLMISSKKNADGTRTDHWKQDKPHAPYLFMIGVGDYAVVKDKWNDIDLYYYVEPEYEQYAKEIFNHTPEMLSFFSEILDYPYPWDKYAQIICKDYVSGAMENTGAVVFGDFIQKTNRELADSNNDDIVAHEMFHHWFGDLVTCESWANLTMNEGFAVYGEFLWQEYKYGNAAAERKRMEDLYGYLSSANSITHDLIDFHYDDKEDMFDGHSYNKGSLIVHMLRKYVGDEAFFAALNKYLVDNEYTDVEAHELRLSFEDLVGEDLNWFFDQWFYGKGHPILGIDYTIDEASRSVKIAVSQLQDPEYHEEVFRLPMETALYYPSGKVEYVTNWIENREQLIQIDIIGAEMPSVVVLDGKHDILSVNKENRSEEEYATLFRLSDEYEDKYTALHKLEGSKFSKQFVEKALKDPSSDIRQLALSSLNASVHKKQLMQLAKNDSDPGIRTYCLKKLNDYDLALNLLGTDQSFMVIGAALDIVNDANFKEGLYQAEKLSQSYHKPLIGTIANIFASSQQVKYLTYFEENVNKVGMFTFFNFMGHYGKLAKLADPERVIETSGILKKLALEESNSYFKKYSSTNLINMLLKEVTKRYDRNPTPAFKKSIDVLNNTLIEIISTTSDEKLKGAFPEYLEKP